MSLQKYKIRKNTVDKNRKKEFINLNDQFFLGILGTRGGGKSWLLEIIMAYFWSIGYTCLDLWSAPNFENYFWCLARKASNRRIPITIIAPDTLITDGEAEEKRHAFNDEWHGQFPLVRIVKVPVPTSKEYTEANHRIFEVVRDAILQCRDERRVFCFNPRIFPDEVAMYRVLEIIFRGIDKVAYDYFDAVEPEDIDLISDKVQKIRALNKHKILFIAREFGELVPARMKGDKSGMSTLVKKAQLKLFRLARHSSVSGAIDYQNASDADSSVRNQIDVWGVKEWNRQLAGENFQWIFDKVDGKHKYIVDYYKGSQKGLAMADSAYPPIEMITHNWFYGFGKAKIPILFPVGDTYTRHKEPTDKWDKITGIPLVHDEIMLKKQLTNVGSKTSKRDNNELFDLLHDLKFNAKAGNGKSIKRTWEEVRLLAPNEIEKRNINVSIDFITISHEQVASKYSKLKLKYKAKSEEKD